MKKVTQLLQFFLLFITPFVVFRIGVSSFEGSKVLVAEGILLLLIGVTCVFSDTKKLFILTPVRQILIVLFLLAIFHLFFLRTDTTLFGNPFRMQGVLLYLLFFLFAWITPQLPKLPVHPVIITLLLALHVCIALTQGLTQNGRFVGSVGEANAFGALVVFLWPFVVVGNSVQKKALRYGVVVISFLLAGTILLLSGSKSAAIAFGIQLFFFISLFIFHWPLKRTVALCLMLIVMSLSLPFFQKHIIYENRVDVWKAALIAGYEHPMTGFGIGNVEVALKEYNVKLYNNVQGYYVDSSHNFLLDWWVMGGYVGMSGILLVLYLTFKQVIRSNLTLASVLLVGIVTVMLFNPASVTTLVPFWWLVGQKDVSS